jgi:large subunit ribosomal protein L29
MDAKELRKLPTTEIEGKLDDAYKELFNLRFQRAQGQLSNTNAIKTVRHNIARLKTTLRQRELAAKSKPVAEVN